MNKTAQTARLKTVLALIALTTISQRRMEFKAAQNNAISVSIRGLTAMPFLSAHQSDPCPMPSSCSRRQKFPLDNTLFLHY